MPPFGGIKPVCHDRHKTLPEFIVILCDQMWMTTTEVRLLMWSSLALFANQGRFDFGTFNFRQLFWKANTYCVYISDDWANWRLLTSIGSPTDFTNSLLRAVGQPTIFGTPLVVRQRIKYSLSTALSFGQNLNLMCVLNDVYISGRPRPTAINWKGIVIHR